MESTPKRSLEEIAEMLESNLMKRMDEFEAQVNPARSSSLNDLSQLAAEFSAFKNIVWNVIKLLKQQIAEVTKNMDVAEMRHRSKFLVLNGVPDSATEDIKSTVADILIGKMGIQDFSLSCLKSCHRLGSYREGHPRSILIKFYDKTVKNTVWRNKSQLKGSSFVVNEFLTRHRQALFITARSHFGMRNVWTLDGNISIKLPNGTRQRIQSRAELEELIVRFDKSSAGSQSHQSNTKSTPVTSVRNEKPPSAPKATTSAPKLKRSTRR